MNLLPNTTISLHVKSQTGKTQELMRANTCFFHCIQALGKNHRPMDHLTLYFQYPVDKDEPADTTIGDLIETSRVLGDSFVLSFNDMQREIDLTSVSVIVLANGPLMVITAVMAPVPPRTLTLMERFRAKLRILN